MQLVQSIDQIRFLSGEVRALHKGFITNYYIDEAKHTIWIAKGDCYVEQVGNTLFIIKQSPSFWNVFYCSTTLDEFSTDLSSFMTDHSDTTMLFDIVGRDVQCQPVVELFLGKGCKEATSLVRMMRITARREYVADSTVRLADERDVKKISQLLHTYFDEQTEQLPYDEELEDFVRQSHVLVCEEQDQMAGFLIYELNASTLYLRYWFTHPDFRDRKVGSRLLRRFFEEGKDTKRQLFWVIRTNENAIKRYKHYGFTEENMYDYIMQFN
jgi:ribosomal protein S18 acetylase RimI-like enzyme